MSGHKTPDHWATHPQAAQRTSNRLAVSSSSSCSSCARTLQSRSHSSSFSFSSWVQAGDCQPALSRHHLPSLV